MALNICTSCDQLWFRSSVSKCNSIKYSDKYSQGLLEECITGTKSATNFEHMVQLFIQDVLKSNLMPIGEMVYLLHRVEFQQRGLPHIHALFWVSSCI